MYDFVFHSNGEIYGPDNGLGVTDTFPASPSAPCDVASVGISDPGSWNADLPATTQANSPTS